jgi:succinate dehydrogenase (ubiquinone) cytochrome b560 subunit
MSLFPSTARTGVSALAGLRSSAPNASSMFRRSFTPLASSVALKGQQSQKTVTMPKSNAVLPSPAAMATHMMIRPFMHSSKRSSVPTNQYSQGEALTLLNEQRSLRPNSPHLTIYQPQVTWYLSILTRMTGVGLSVLFYGWAITYFALPYTTVGQAFTSAHLVQYAALAPFWLKVGLKAPIAFAMSFHSYNGLRHLAWDIGYGLSMKGVYMGAYIVLGASVATTAYLLTL